MHAFCTRRRALRFGRLPATHLLVFPGKPDRPYFESWLRRTRKQLAASGRLSEIALILSREEGHSPQYWSSWLREVLEEEATPSLDLLTRIDAILAPPVRYDIPLETPPLFGDSC